MVERHILIDGRLVIYTGLYRADELYHILRSFFGERGYFAIEKRSQEDVLESGKQIVVETEAGKRFNDYAKGVIKVSINVKSLKDKTITLNGHKQKYQHGDIRIKLTAIMETDRRSQWEGSGLAFLFRTISDKFIRHDFIHAMQQQTAKDCGQLADELKAYLNMNRFKIANSESRMLD
jgi:hypothetical protein